MPSRLVPVETLTGKPIVAQLPVTEQSWSREMGAPGAGTFKIPTSGLDPELIRKVATGWGTTLVSEWVEGDSRTAEYAGIVQRVEWDGRTLAVHTAELPIMLTKRHLFAVQANLPTRSIRGRRLRDVLVQLIRNALWDETTPRWQFPIITEWPDIDGSIVRTFPWWQFTTAADAVASIVADDEGLLYDFHPEWHSESLKWQLRVNDFHAGAVDIPVSTPEFPVVSGARVSVTRDWQEQLTGVFAIGNGEDEAIRWGRASSSDVPIAPSIPYLDRAVSWVQVEDVGLLNRIARGELRSRRYGVDQWTIEVTGSDLVPPTRWRPGTVARLLHPGDALVPRGAYEAVVLKVASNGGAVRTLTVQEKR